MCIKWTIRIREGGCKEDVGRHILLDIKQKIEISEISQNWIFSFFLKLFYKAVGCNKTKKFQFGKFTNWRKSSFCVWHF